jgi:hypothetical protein
MFASSTIPFRRANGAELISPGQRPGYLFALNRPP